MNPRLSSQRSELDRPRTSLSRRFAIVLLPLVLIPLLLMGAAAYFRARGILRSQVTGQLSSAAEAQVQALTAWVQEREQRLLIGSQRDALRSAAAAVLTSPEAADAEARQAARQELEQLRLRGESEVMFSDILIVRLPDGLVLASTRESWEGKLLPAIQQGRLAVGRLATTALYDDPLFAPSNVALVSAVPMRALAGDEPDSMLVGVNTDLRLGTLMEELQVYWEQRGPYRVERGETFLILEPNVVLFLGRYSMAPNANAGVAHPVFSLIRQNPSGTAEYDDTQHDPALPVLGAYQWIPEMGLGVVVELPQQEVFAELTALVPFTLALILGAVAVTVLVVTLVTNRLLRPLDVLTGFAGRMARGEWNYRVPEDRDDELGVLAAALNRMADDLSGLYRSLEARVAARTRQIRTASEVARAVVSTPSLDDLLSRAVELIRDRFGYYHVSIFLLDDKGEYAVLREATGEIGGALKARGHRLAVGSQSIIGWVTANNQPRVASDVGEDPVHFKNELLPETRSEAAVPLQVGGRVMGALDVQSTDPDAFKPEDIEVLQTLADQISAAIQNAQLAKRSAEAADRARLISEVTTQLSGMLEVDRVLQTAAQAVHHGLGGPEVVVRVTSA